LCFLMAHLTKLFVYLTAIFSIASPAHSALIASQTAVQSSPTATSSLDITSFLRRLPTSVPGCDDQCSLCIGERVAGGAYYGYDDSGHSVQIIECVLYGDCYDGAYSGINKADASSSSSAYVAWRSAQCPDYLVTTQFAAGAPTCVNQCSPFPPDHIWWRSCTGIAQLTSNCLCEYYPSCSTVCSSSLDSRSFATWLSYYCSEGSHTR
jgi:hypothetical protein